MHYLTSESVSMGHPDKVADQISDAVLDAHLEQDALARVAAETLISHDLIVLAGEISSTAANIDYVNLAKKVIKDIGYNSIQEGFDLDHCTVIANYKQQSQDIAVGVQHQQGLDMGAGDQGIMFGYAIDETESFMPFPIHNANKLMRAHADLRKKYSWLKPDAKTQLTVKYDDNGVVESISNIVFSTQHSAEAELAKIKECVIEEIIKPNIDSKFLTSTKYHINPTGQFIIGGPLGDCGVTGRKIIVDTYGGAAPHGGGAFSGKDPSKVDRSAAYFLRYVAKNIVANKLAKRCLIQIAYSIGQPAALGLNINTYGTGAISDEAIKEIILQNFDFRPQAIIQQLDLLRPIYLETARFGHFGISHYSWEKIITLK